MRNWKRFLGLSKLSAMAAIALTSCSEWAANVENPLFRHTGMTYPWGAGWRWSLNDDARQDSTDATAYNLRDYIVDIKIMDICDPHVVEYHRGKCLWKIDSVAGNNPLEYTLKLDPRTDDSVLLKKIMPEYAPNMSLQYWIDHVADKMDRSTAVYVDMERGRPECHIDKYGPRVLKPHHIVRVWRDAVR